MMVLEAWKGARFIGLYVSFPIQKENRQTGILVELLKLHSSAFNRMKFGRLSRGLRTAKFTQELLSEALRSLGTGEADWLQLSPAKSGVDWVRTYDDHVHLSWESSVIEPINRPYSPVEERFGSAGSVIVTYPESWFKVDSETSFQKSLLLLVKKLAGRHNIYWSFIHQGFRQKRPAGIGEDDVFQQTRENFPLTSFDADLGTAAIFFKEFVKGAFWVNFLNPFHVRSLGGTQRIKENLHGSIIEELGDGHINVQVGPSPLFVDHQKATSDYQHLRRFLKPILLETPDDRLKFQMNLLGSWRPPGYDTHWRRVPSETPKR